MKLIKVTHKENDIESWLNRDEILGITRSEGSTHIGLKDGRNFPVDQTVEELLTQLED